MTSRAAVSRRRGAGLRRGRAAPAVAVTGTVAVLVLTGCAPGSGSPDPARDGRLTVVASTDVWGDVVSSVAGPGVEVRSILSDPAADPHSYESTAADAAAVAGADVVVVNGGGYDGFARRLLDAVGGARARVIEAFGLRADRADDNEHVWFEPAAVRGVAGRVAERLAALQPARAGDLRRRAAAFIARVDAVFGRLAEIGRARPDARVAATEPVAHYLLTSAGLTDVTPPEFVEAVESDSGPPASALAATQDLVSSRRVAAVVFNPQTETPVTAQIRDRARRAGVPVVEVTETLPPGTDYLTWVDRERAALAAALGAPA